MPRADLFFMCIPFLFIAASAATAEDFQSADAKSAQKQFETAMKSARTAYIASLNAAAKQAIKDNQLDEAIRIKEKIKDLKSQQQDDAGDPVVRLRRRIRNTTWTFNRPGKPRTISFHRRNRVTSAGTTGVWETLEPRLLILKFDDNLFLFQFDEKLKNYRARAYGPIPSDFKGGKKIR